jgi:hypothetical protein
MGEEKNAPHPSPAVMVGARRAENGPVTTRRWEYRTTDAERDLWAQLLPWGDCTDCGARTQQRIVERENGIPNGREWFVCERHLETPMGRP